MSAMTSRVRVQGLGFRLQDLRFNDYDYDDRATLDPKPQAQIPVP